MALVRGAGIAGGKALEILLEVPGKEAPEIDAVNDACDSSVKQDEIRPGCLAHSVSDPPSASEGIESWLGQRLQMREGEAALKHGAQYDRGI